MKNKDILKLLNENKIDELKNKLIQEIGLEENKEIPTYKAIQNLSKIAERNQRNHKKADGTYYYVRGAIAGAYYLDDNKTAIMDISWGLLLNSKLDGLVMAEDTGTNPRLDKIIPTDIDNVERYEKTEFAKVDENGLKNLLKIDKEYKVEFGCNKYPAQQFVNIYDCLEDVVVYVPKSENRMLVIKGSNGTGVICALRY